MKLNKYIMTWPKGNTRGNTIKNKKYKPKLNQTINNQR